MSRYHCSADGQKIFAATRSDGFSGAFSWLYGESALGGRTSNKFLAKRKKTEVSAEAARSLLIFAS